MSTHLTPTPYCFGTTPDIPRPIEGNIYQLRNNLVGLNNLAKGGVPFGDLDVSIDENDRSVFTELPGTDCTLAYIISTQIGQLGELEAVLECVQRRGIEWGYREKVTAYTISTGGQLRLAAMERSATEREYYEDTRTGTIIRIGGNQSLTEYFQRPEDCQELVDVIDRLQAHSGQEPNSASVPRRKFWSYLKYFFRESLSVD